MTKRLDILDEAHRLTGGDRAASYGAPVPNMQETATMWSSYLRTRGVEVDLTGEDVANLMVLLKMARTGATHKEDNYVDGAAYMAIAGECSFAERGEELGEELGGLPVEEAKETVSSAGLELGKTYKLVRQSDGKAPSKPHYWKVTEIVNGEPFGVKPSAPWPQEARLLDQACIWAEVRG